MRKQDAWARFWNGGSLTSFGDKFADGYQGEIRVLWAEFFASLPERAIVVDLGAGNGALEEIAQKYCADQQRALVLHAFDLASPQPSRFKEETEGDRCAISWHPETANEATGLENASVDAVIGNYAFEYGDGGETIAEIERILKPDGRCRFLMHHVDSNIIANARSELAVLEMELEKGGFMDAVRDYLLKFHNIRTPSQFENLKLSGQAEPLRRRMNDTHQRALQQATMENAIVLIQQIMQWTGQLVSPPAFFEDKSVLLDRLHEIRQELAANRSRLRDMQAAAVDQQKMERIIECFRSHDMTASAEPFLIPEEPITVGWSVFVHRG